MSFDKRSTSPRGRIYQATVQRYRRRRTTPRPDAPDCFEDPAPDWVWQLAEAVLEHTAREPDSGRRMLEEALAWCEGCSTPEARSAALVVLLGAPLGPPQLVRLRRYLDAAWRAGAA